MYSSGTQLDWKNLELDTEAPQSLNCICRHFKVDEGTWICLSVYHCAICSALLCKTFACKSVFDFSQQHAGISRERKMPHAAVSGQSHDLTQCLCRVRPGFLFFNIYLFMCVRSGCSTQDLRSWLQLAGIFQFVYALWLSAGSGVVSHANVVALWPMGS